MASFIFFSTLIFLGGFVVGRASGLNSRQEVMVRMQPIPKPDIQAVHIPETPKTQTLYPAMVPREAV